MDQKTKEQRFVDLYEVEIGPWPARSRSSQQRMWFDFIAGVPAGQLERLFDKVAYNRGDDRRKPTLRQFKQAWRNLKPDKPAFRPAGRDPCGVCNDLGRLSVELWSGYENGQFAWQFTADDQHPVAPVSVPCKCSTGMVWRTRPVYYGLPTQMVDEAFEVCRQKMREMREKYALPENVAKQAAEQKTSQTVEKHQSGENVSETGEKSNTTGGCGENTSAAAAEKNELPEVPF